LPQSLFHGVDIQGQGQRSGTPGCAAITTFDTPGHTGARMTCSVNSEQ